MSGEGSNPAGLLAAELFTTLKHRIVHWDYLPGHRFAEEDLCKEFGVSRSPVREALRMLTEHGLVDRIPYRGCTVKQPDFNEIHELYDVRVALETFAIERVATRGFPREQWDELHSRWRALKGIRSEHALAAVDLAQEDRAFHEELARATGNETLMDLLRDINERIHFVRMTDIISLERLWDTCSQHLQILEHIADGDKKAATEAMRQNIEGARAQVESAIKEVVARAYMRG